MTLTRDAISAVVRALELGHDVKLVLEERIDADGRVSLPAAPAQAALAAELDAEVAALYEAGELHDTDTPSTSTRVRGRGVGITFSERRPSELQAGHGRVIFTKRERAAVTDVNNLLSVYPRPTVDEACEQVAPRYDVRPNTLKGWRKAMLRAAREAQEEAA